MGGRAAAGLNENKANSASQLKLGLGCAWQQNNTQIGRAEEGGRIEQQNWTAEQQDRTGQQKWIAE